MIINGIPKQPSGVLFKEDMTLARDLEQEPNITVYSSPPEAHKWTSKRIFVDRVTMKLTDKIFLEGPQNS